MSYILNLIKEKVQKSVSVQVLPAKYDKYPVVVTDNSDSFTKGWSATYMFAKSKYENGLYDTKGRFSEITLTGASAIISDLQAVYSKFMSGESVVQKYNTSMATYQPNDKVWYTVMQKQKGISISLTVLDENSPFHMLQASFFVMQNGDPNKNPLIGYDKCFNAQADTWTDSQGNVSMAPAKEPVLPIVVEKGQNGMNSLVKMNGVGVGNGIVKLDTNPQVTTIKYVQHISNERRTLAALYEDAILSHALEYANANLPVAQTQSAPQNNIGWGFNAPQNTQQNQQSFNQQPQQSFDQQPVPTGADPMQNVSDVSPAF